MPVQRVTKEHLATFLANLTPAIKERVFDRGVRAYLSTLAGKLKDDFTTEAVVKLATEGLSAWGKERKVGSKKLGKRLVSMVQNVCFNRVMDGKLPADQMLALRDNFITQIEAELAANPNEPSPTIQAIMAELGITSKPKKTEEPTEQAAA